MPVRTTQERRDVINGRQEIVVRVFFDEPSADSEVVEVAATVRVPAIDSDEQLEAAARQSAKRALERALSAFPL